MNNIVLKNKKNVDIYKCFCSYSNYFNEYNKKTSENIKSIEEKLKQKYFEVDYYDKETDKSEVIDIEGRTVIISTDIVTVDIIKKEFKVFGKTVSLGQPYNLNPFLNNWQIKDVNDIMKFRIGIL